MCFDIRNDVLKKYNGNSACVFIPNNVKSIGNEAFYRCRSLTSVTIPDSVTSIWNSAFSYCSSLTSVTIPDSVTRIWDSAFRYCSSLTSITIPDSVKYIGEDAFRGCNSLENITFLGNKCKFGKTPFGPRCSGGIPEGLKDKCFSLIPRFTDGRLKEYILETDLWGTMTPEQQSEVFLSRQSKTLTPGYLQCIADDQLEAIGNALEDCLNKKPSAKECSAVALYMTGFKDRIPDEKLQALYALLKPAKAASKVLTIRDNDFVLQEKLGQKMTVDENLAPAERLVMERLISEKKHKRILKTNSYSVMESRFRSFRLYWGKTERKKSRMYWLGCYKLMKV